jgi:hypothetical protein
VGGRGPVIGEFGELEIELVKDDGGVPVGWKEFGDALEELLWEEGFDGEVEIRVC